MSIMAEIQSGLTSVSYTHLDVYKRQQEYQPEKLCTFLYMFVHSDVCAVFVD